MKKFLLTIATVCIAGSGCSWFGSAGCPSMTIFDCPEGQIKVCETTEEGRCCGCDTPKSTRPAEAKEP
jgi:hypothetical protein